MLTRYNVQTFTYDENSSLLGFAYDGQDYWYIRNGQGDVIGILDKDGNEVVSYTYDSWGAPTSTTGSLAETIGQLNPFRYRGYYFDAELGLYYLNSRYYDPMVGRFINSDAIASTGNTTQKKNIYTYCGNNPIMRSDPTGFDFFDWLLDQVWSWFGMEGHFQEKAANSSVYQVSSSFYFGMQMNNYNFCQSYTQSLTNTMKNAAQQDAITNRLQGSITPSLPKTNTTNSIQPYYPPNNGYTVNTQRRTTLQPGTILQRQGGFNGKFMAPAGTRGDMLSLPPQQKGNTISLLIVTKPMEVNSGIAAPWFGQPGGGIQYDSLLSVNEWIEYGFIELYGE